MGLVRFGGFEVKPLMDIVMMVISLIYALFGRKKGKFLSLLAPPSQRNFAYKENNTSVNIFLTRKEKMERARTEMQSPIRNT